MDPFAPQPRPSARGDGDASDPDADGLPPGAALPDRGTFARNQLFAMMVTNAAVLVLLTLWWAIQPSSVVAQVCAIAVAAVLAVSFVRWVRARSM